MSHHLEVCDLMGQIDNACRDHEKVVKALEQVSAILMATVTAGRLSENDDFSFTGKWQRLGRVRVGKALDLANDALAIIATEGNTNG